ncbi:hypothetical protein [Sphingorhabdus sp. Alg231-15]|uniref:hypothetical protein n=1 Tax=Sphingorhabdus sp. Alg231-15 TaxID=1922222 RepID=UPI000D55E241
MSNNIFWAWQSDLDQNQNRHFIKKCLEEAAEKFALELNLEERPEIDHGTKNRRGLAAIADSILEKIDDCKIFVADLTPITVSKNGKYSANPNVLFELGYAVKNLTFEQIILVWNRSYAGTQPEELPFDLRHRTGPIGYNLSTECSKADRTKVRSKLVNELYEAIKINWPQDDPSQSFANQWCDDHGHGPASWTDQKEQWLISDSRKTENWIQLYPAQSFCRILPASWPKNMATSKLQHTYPIGHWSGLDNGKVKGGLLTYNRVNIAGRDFGNAFSTCAMWFSSNGEIWSFDSDVYPKSESTLYCDGYSYITSCAEFVQRHLTMIDSVGGKGPYRIKMGMIDLQGKTWLTPLGRPGGRATEEFFDFEFVTTDYQASKTSFWEAWTKLCDCFGHAPGDETEFISQLPT